MKHFRLIFGLALIPMCAFLGSFVPIGKGGSGIIIGLVVGIALSYFFLTYGPDHKKNQLPISYYENRDQQPSIPVFGPVIDPQQPLPQPYLDNSLFAPWDLRGQEASGGQEEYQRDEYLTSDAQGED